MKMDEAIKAAKAANNDRGNALAILLEGDIWKSHHDYFRKAQALNIPIEEAMGTLFFVTATAAFSQLDPKADGLLKALGAAEVTAQANDAVKHAAVNYIKGRKE